MLSAGPTTSQPTEQAPRPAGPRLERQPTGGWLTGVANGIAAHLGISVWAIRASFVVLTGAGLGPVLYAVFWIVLPTSGPQKRWRGSGLGYLIAALACLGGVALAAWSQPLGNFFVPSVLAALGGALIWRQAGDTQRKQWWNISRRSLTATSDTGRLRLIAGVAFVLIGGVLVIAKADLTALRDGLVAVAVTVIGLGLITGPWWVEMVSELGQERRERIRSQERAEIAAKLHDSVLQTLALIQRNANSPREVARLARGQERELRTLLYGPTEKTGQLSEALTATAAEIEDAYAVTVDAVVVGDAALNPDLAALVDSCREALQNAAKHAQVTGVSLYVEVEARAVVAYVRDRGVGFDVDQVAADRQGVRGSIIARMERHGGVVTIRSTAGDGTEVGIRLPYESTRSHEPDEVQQTPRGPNA